jgi:hypothetical protein
MFVAVITAAILLLVNSIAMGSNPADLTSSYRLCPVQFYMLADDGDSWFGCGTYPIAEKTAVTYLHWQSQDGEVRDDQAAIVRSLAPSLDVAVMGELWRCGSLPARSEIALDLHGKGAGFGLILPLQHAESIKAGPRLGIGGGWTGYLTLSHRQAPIIGVSGPVAGLTLEFAKGKETWFCRASKTCGQLVPEIRLRVVKGNLMAGFSVGYNP